MSPFARRKHSAKAAIDRAIRDMFAAIPGHHAATTAAFQRLLRHVRGRSGLLHPPGGAGRYELKGYDDVLAGLLSLATFDWLRPVEDWEPAGDNPLPQFSSLARHLLAAYPVPDFMTSVWFKGPDAEARRQQRWYAHVGAGRNIRTADLPLPYTKMMAHHFLQAPHHLTVEQALRWGQVRGLGGSKGLAMAVAATRLGRSFDSEDFWVTVVHFFVNHPDLDTSQVGPIVDYLHHQRFVPQEVCLEESELINLGPPQPDLSMKGRTPRSLSRQVAEWQRGLGRWPRMPTLWWPRCGIGEFRLAEPGIEGPGQRVWTIRELHSSRQLRIEGKSMHHCVADYVRLCLKKRSSIWSTGGRGSGRPAASPDDRGRPGHQGGGAGQPQTKHGADPGGPRDPRALGASGGAEVGMLSRRTLSAAKSIGATTESGMATIKYIKGDATQPQAKGNRIIAHVCNDLGGWGKGFVLAVSKRWPEPEEAYRAWHRDRSKNDFGLGAVQLVQVEPYIWVANMVAQRGMKTGSNGPPIRYEAVRACLRKLAAEAKRSGGERPHAPDRMRPGRRAGGSRSSRSSSTN